MVEIEIVELVFYGFGIFALGVIFGAAFGLVIAAVLDEVN